MPRKKMPRKDVVVSSKTQGHHQCGTVPEPAIQLRGQKLNAGKTRLRQGRRTNGIRESAPLKNRAERKNHDCHQIVTKVDPKRAKNQQTP